MGSAAEAAAEAAAASTASASASSNEGGPRWAVGERAAPLSRRPAVLTRVGAMEPHPLAQTLGGASVSASVGVETPRAPASSTEQQPPVTQLEEKRVGQSLAELVVLGDGDIDPLGALSSSQSAPNRQGAGPDTSLADAKSATTGALTAKPLEDAPLTVKQQWKAHTDRVMAKYADHTFKIQASMLETGDLEREISLDSSRGLLTDSKAASQQDGSAAADAADGVDVIRKSRERLEELELKQYQQQQGSGASQTPLSGSRQGDRMLELSQREYVARVKRMETQMRAAWARDQKVLALRLAIKCVKLLGDTSTAPQLYPCVFVLVSDALDVFGELVFNRIKARASEDEAGQPLGRALADNFTTADVNVHAKETCRNWFYKTACIRELLPRIYIEIALLPCYRFLCDGEYPQIVARLSNMIKGIGDPLVAIYAWTYLALASSEFLTGSGIGSSANGGITGAGVVVGSLSDFFFTFHQFQTSRNQLDKYLSAQNMSLDDYLGLQSPAVEWLMQCASANVANSLAASSFSMLMHGKPPPNGKRMAFEQLLDQFSCYSQYAMVLQHLCERFDASECYADDPSRLLGLIQGSRASPSFPHSHLYSVLALQLSNCESFLAANEGDHDPLNRQQQQYQERLAFLNELWDSVTTKSDRVVGGDRELELYMECAAATMKLVVVHYSPREALLLLRDVVRHVNAATQQELTPRAFNLLGALIENVVVGAQRRYAFFRKIVPSSEFLSLLGMFGRDASVSVARQVLRAFVRSGDRSSATVATTVRASVQQQRLPVIGPEAAVAHTLFVLCCRIHDALDSLHATLAAREDATRDICAFIFRLGANHDGHTDASGRAREQEQSALLELFVDCRRAFYKLERVQAALVTRVLALAVSIHHDAQRKRGGKAHELVKSCLAYAHITIPSIAAPSSVLAALTAYPQSDWHKQPWLVKLELLVQTANVALVTGCLPQLDAAIKAAVFAIADLSLERDVLAVANAHQRRLHTDDKDASVVGHQQALNELARVITGFVSILIYSPSLTDDDAFYFVRALRKAVLERLLVIPARETLVPDQQLYEAVAVASARVRVQFALLQLLACWGQRKLPPMCHDEHGSAGLSVEANDVLYGGYPEFQRQVTVEFSSTVDACVREIEAIGGIGEREGGAYNDRKRTAVVTAAQVELMLDFINETTPVLEFAPSMSVSDGLTSDVGDLSASSEAKEGARRRRRSSGARSGAVLVRKCWQFVSARLDALEEMQQGDGGDTTGNLKSETSKQERDSVGSSSRKPSVWLARYRSATREFVAQFATEKRKQLDASGANGSVMQALVDSLSQ